jgi:outer membrane cobalamin receptor
LYLQYRLAGPFALYGRVENVLDTRYETAFDQPGIRRTIAFGFRIES